MKKNCLVLFLLILLAVNFSHAQKKTKASPRNGRGIIGVGRAGGGAISKSWIIAPDLPARLARYKSVRMPLQARLTPRERQMLDKLVEAGNYLESIFWRQSDPQALSLYQALERSQFPRDQEVRRFLFLNAGRFDLLDNNKCFIGNETMPPGRGLYPPGLTRAEIEAYVKAHPEKKAEIYSPYTVVVRHGDELEGIPYHVVYRPFLVPAAAALRDAALLSPDPHFANFLRLRADSLLNDDYYNSDLLWLDLQDPRFDLIFGPYETYLDEVLGVKTSYSAAILIRDDKESQKLAEFQKYVPEIQDALPLPAADRPTKKGLQSPMEVVDSPFRTGDFDHGYQAVADNLPNDPRVHQTKGTKKIFFRNFLEARVDYIVLPLARRMMRSDQATLASSDGYLAHTMMHEIAHGLGPAFARVGGKQADIREAIGPLYSGLEEAKADVLGVYGLMWLMDHGVLPEAKRNEYYASYVADMFRSVRFGVGEAHSKAEMMEFNYLAEKGVIVRDNGAYGLDFAKMGPAIEALSRELLEQEATGDRTRTEAWFARYGAMPPELKAALDKQTDVPLDLAPEFSFPVKVK